MLLACQFREQDRILITAPVTLSPEPLILTPRPPLTATGYFNKLCIAVPPGYEEDTQRWQLRAPDGSLIEFSAVLQARSGAQVELDSLSFTHARTKRYACLSRRGMDDYGDEQYGQVVLRATVAIETHEIRWFSTDKG